ncbi:MAG: hypothetical protein ABIX28_12030 [Vicinamibacterales bacterium]
MLIVKLGIALALGTVVSLPAIGYGQEPIGRARTPAKGDSIRVKGCLMGPTLESLETVVTDEVGKTSGPMTYQLRGDKDLLKRMRAEHDGNQVEVEGILKSSLPQDDATRSKKVGKTKITFGVGTPTAQRGVPDAHTALPVLEVKSYDGAGARCSR